MQQTAPGVQKYKKGTQATIEAIPDSGWEFDQWSGVFSKSSLRLETKKETKKGWSLWLGLSFLDE